jgi:hypothetical protein
MVQQVGLKGRLPGLQQLPSIPRFNSTRNLVFAQLLAFTCSLSVCSATEPPVQIEPPIASVSEMPIVDGRTIGCRSAQNWRPSELLRMRGRTLVQLYCEEDDCARSAAHTLASFLSLQASFQDDIGAATAMRAYYTRIAITEQLSLAAESLEFLNLQGERQQALMERGSAATTDLSAFERQRIEILDQRLQLEAQDRQLQSLLEQLTKLDYISGDVHQERLEVFPNALNCERLERWALSQRQDLNAWKLLASRVNQESAPEFAKMLPTLVGGWTLPLPSLSRLTQLICKEDYSCLAANMRSELDAMVETQSEWISQSVMEKCSKLELSYRRIELADQVITSWRERIVQLERLQEHGAGQPEQSALARSEFLKARSQEISRRLEARLAELDLAEATGGLALRCCHGQAWLQTGL